MAAKKLYAEGLVNFALKDLGVKESPPNSNKVKFNTWFYGRAVRGSKYPWCLAAQCYWFNKAGYGKLFYGGKRCAGTQAFEAWAINHNLTVPVKNGRYGDLALFKFTASYVHHVGMILKKNADGTYQVLEGNTSLKSNDNGGRVMIRTRKQSDIKTIFRPKYDQHPIAIVTATCSSYKDMDILSKRLAKHAAGSKVRWIKDMKNGWSKIIDTTDGEISYIKNAYIKKAKTKLSTYAKATIATKAALRSKNSARSTQVVKGMFPAGKTVQVVTKRKFWTNVKVDGYSGYMSTRKLKFKK